jgi:hypothetical protein
VALLDASQTGVRLVVRERLEKDQAVTVILIAPGQEALKRAGTVTWAVPGADGRWCVGVRLHERLPYASLIHLTEL